MLKQTSVRQQVIAARAARPAGEGPQTTHYTIPYEEVDRYRRLGCARYDECLTEVAIAGTCGWRCPEGCAWYREAPPAPTPWHEEEPEGGEGPQGARGYCTEDC